MRVTTYSSAAFAGARNTCFRVTQPDGPAVELELVAHIESPTSPGYEHFVVEFTGPLDQPLAQGTYAFEHAALGTLDIFISPRKRTETAFEYDAVFDVTCEKEGAR